MRPHIAGAFHQQLPYLEYFGFGIASSKMKLKYYVSRFVLLLPNLMHVYAMVWQIAVSYDDPKSLQVILYFGTHIGALCKTINFTLKSHVLERIQQMLQRPSFNAQDRCNDEFIAKSNFRMHAIAKTFELTCYITIILYAIMGYLTSTLPLGGKYCRDEEKYFYLFYVVQLIGLFQLAICVINIDCVSIIFMQLGSNQFDVLKSNLEHIRHTNDEEVFENLSTQVKFHNEILEYCELVEELLHSGIFAQFMSNAPAICFSLLQLVLVSSNLQMSIVVMYLLCILIQLGMYCWFGHFVIVKSAEVIDACYMSDWYKCNPKTKVFFFLIMERARRPTFFTAGKFFKLSLTTYMMILKSSYSYFAVVKQMYDS